MSKDDPTPSLPATPRAPVPSTVKKKELDTTARVLKACRERPVGVTAASVSRDLGVPLGEVQAALADHQNQGNVREKSGFYYLTPEGQTKADSA